MTKNREKRRASASVAELPQVLEAQVQAVLAHYFKFRADLRAAPLQTDTLVWLNLIAREDDMQTALIITPGDIRSCSKSMSRMSACVHE